MQWFLLVCRYLSWILWPLRAFRSAPVPAGSSETPGEPAAPRSRGCLFTVLLWTLHLLLLAVVLVGLWYVNRHFGLERLLRSDWPSLHAYWLSILFLLLYALVWLGWWLWRLAGPESVGWDYPDINAAWEEATAALAEAGLDLQAVPLFLVLGRPHGIESALFAGADLALRVHQTPRTPDAPLHVYASTEAIFVTCAGASVLGQYLTLLAEDHARRQETMQREATLVAARTQPARGAMPADASAQRTGAEVDLPDATGATVATETEVLGSSALPAGEQGLLGVLEAGDKTEPLGRWTRSHRFLKDQAVVQLHTYRLQHLCRLIAQDRRPFCPLNGVLVLLPFAATADDQDASEAGSACRCDMTLLRQVLEVQCPGFALVCDMEESAGFREMLRRLPPAQRVRRLGQRFPLLPDLEEAQIPSAVERSIAWLCDVMIPSLVYNLFRPELEDSLGSNGNLYRFVVEMRGRRRRLSRLLARAFLLDLPVPSLFGGIYFAATVRDTGPSLVSGVLSRLVEGQNYVSWLASARYADARYRRWTFLGWLGILTLVVGVPVAAYLLWRW